MTDGPSSDSASDPASEPSCKPSPGSLLASPPAPVTTLLPRTLLLVTILAAVLAYGICLNLRLVEAPAWSQERFQVQGEPLMATHDAYYFLAGAQGTGRPHPDHEGFFRLTRIFQTVTGMSLNQLGFWLPVFLAPLVVFPLAWLAWREGMPEAVLPMGILAGGSMGFLVRTRLGYYDHDMLSLLLPVLFAAGLLVFLDRWLASRTNPSSDRPEAGMGGLIAGCLGLGLLGWGYLGFYASGQPILAGTVVMGLVLVVLLGGDMRRRILLGLALGGLYVLAVNPLLGLLILALVGLVFGPLVKRFGQGWPLGVAVAGLAGLMLIGAEIHILFYEVMRQLGKYAPMLGEGNQTSADLVWPSVMQSVREARVLSPFFMAERSGGTWWLFAAGVVGYVYLCWHRPLYLIFLPLMALALGSVKLGARFTMYGGVPAGLGLGIGLALLLRNLGLRQRVATLVLTAFGLVAAALIWAQVQGLTPRPIMARTFAETLQELRHVAAQDARIWLWWDYGYATQYYSQRASFGDGTLNSGSYLYPMALVHSTHSPLQAAQMIKLVTSSQMERWHQAGAPHQESGQIPWPLYLQRPLTDWRDLPGDEVQSVVDSLAAVPRGWLDDLPEQLFLLSWDNLNLSPWITTFGNWDLRTGQGQGGRMQRVSADVHFDLETGFLVPAEGEPIPLDGFLHIEGKSSREQLWENDSGRFAVYNDSLKQLLLMDRILYKSMLVRMLLADPGEFAKYFELIVDRFPWARVYRVR
ncbi:STT3 domain-containing protein [Desulfonatronum thiodismutans]|uniref:STT3 domain-containing protein n=1 Tax=Desulfonatronum thiodismutans TaxID=159290 RepID=UPI00126964CE|nr:STT3 domain-containing protein [Desulfonatronum thiodismutans]